MNPNKWVLSSMLGAVLSMVLLIGYPGLSAGIPVLTSVPGGIVATPSRFGNFFKKYRLDTRLSDALFTALARLSKDLDHRPLRELVEEFNSYFREINATVTNKVHLMVVPSTQSKFPAKGSESLQLSFSTGVGPVFEVVIPLESEEFANDAQYSRYLYSLGVLSREDHDNFKLLKIWLYPKELVPNAPMHAIESREGNGLKLENSKTLIPRDIPHSGAHASM